MVILRLQHPVSQSLLNEHIALHQGCHADHAALKWKLLACSVCRGPEAKLLPWKHQTFPKERQEVNLRFAKFNESAMNSTGALSWGILGHPTRRTAATFVADKMQPHTVDQVDIVTRAGA